MEHNVMDSIREEDVNNRKKNEFIRRTNEWIDVSNLVRKIDDDLDIARDDGEQIEPIDKTLFVGSSNQLWRSCKILQDCFTLFRWGAKFESEGYFMGDEYYFRCKRLMDDIGNFLDEQI